jgi:hypothetical protein
MYALGMRAIFAVGFPGMEFDCKMYAAQKHEYNYVFMYMLGVECKQFPPSKIKLFEPKLSASLRHVSLVIIHKHRSFQLIYCNSF